MFIVTKFSMGIATKFDPEYMVIHKSTKQVKGFGTLDECNIMCDALNNKYYPVINYNSNMKEMLRNED